MPCCGSQRQAFAASPSQRRLAKALPASAPVQAAVTAPSTSPPAEVFFQYRGSSALNVQNPATGRRYVFAEPGARLRADPADTTWLAAFPWLSRVA
jgi:hypothetical protein